jgi:hypothetical protein
VVNHLTDDLFHSSLTHDRSATADWRVTVEGKECREESVDCSNSASEGVQSFVFMQTSYNVKRDASSASHSYYNDKT